MVTTTPTPTQFLCPKNVTEEQDAYARGFVDALAKLYQDEAGMPRQEAMSQAQAQVSEVIPQQTMNTTTTLTTLQPVVTTVPQVQQQIQQPVQNNVAITSAPAPAYTLPQTSMPVVTNPPQTIDMSSIPISSMPAHLGHVKEEPQTVPCMEMTPPISPIDMDTQERIKIDRKRERNRVAARKCRTRKLERIARLEDRVRQLKGENSDLSTTATSLRDQVAKLKQQIMQHVNSGCQVMMSQNLL